MKSINISLYGGMLAFRALFEWINPAVFLAIMVCTPALQIIFFASFGPAFSHLDAAYFATGNALQVCGMSAVYGTSQTIANERLFGAINNVFISPAGRVPLYVGRALPHVAIGALSALIGLAGVALATGMSLSADQWLSMLPLVLIATASCSGIGMLFGALGLLGRDTTITGNLAYYALLILSGAAIPSGELPRAIAALARCLPLTNAITALRHLVAAGPDARFWRGLAVEAGVGVAWLSFTVLLLSWVEQRARHTGSLDYS